MLLVTHTPEVAEQFERVERLENFNQAVAVRMSLWKIAWRSIQQRALASSLTGHFDGAGRDAGRGRAGDSRRDRQSFLNNRRWATTSSWAPKAAGSIWCSTRSITCARPVENIPYTYYLEFTEGKFKPYVDKAVPLCLGDMYQDFRVIGTTPGFFQRSGIRRQQV